MRKPNKIERMNAYLYAWAILTGRIESPINQSTNCVCPMLKNYYFEQVGELRSYTEVLQLYPEFAVQKPKRKGYLDQWFRDNDKQSRITALENAIKLLA